MSNAQTIKRPVVFACIPAFNEERTIGAVILLTRKHVNQIFVCDDGSVDTTGDIAESLGTFVIRRAREQQWIQLWFNVTAPG